MTLDTKIEEAIYTLAFALHVESGRLKSVITLDQILIKVYHRGNLFKCINGRIEKYCDWYCDAWNKEDLLWVIESMQILRRLLFLKNLLK